jgi:CheY-like chemotaxis protein
MAQPKRGTLSGLKVLVVDDQPDILSCVGSLLRISGATVQTTTSTSEAFELLQECCPDVVISDYSMPEMDGCEFLRLVRAKLKECSPPAAILSALSSAGDRAAASRAGFEAYMVKPIDYRELTSVVAKLAGRCA